MRRYVRLLSVGGSLVLVAGLGGSAKAAGPSTTSITIVGDPLGLRPAAEIATGHGTVIDTFRGALGTIRIVGRPYV